MRSIRILGLMTGSSADGLDLCLVRFTGTGMNPSFEILNALEIPYPSRFQSAFKSPLEINDDDLQQLDQDLGQWFASEIEQLDLSFDLIASHGQTIRHEPPHFTLQIGDPNVMADLFKCPVIYDFRTADLELGGQGAPLIPIVDQFLLQNASTDILSLNIGGIANLTIVPSLNNPNPLLAWDTGPGNTLIDKAVRKYSSNRLNFDKDGAIAAEGNLNKDLLDALLKHEFYKQKPPRSAGQEQFGDGYFNLILDEFFPESDQAFKNFIFTLTVLTSRTIVNSIKLLNQNYSPTLMVLGGGGSFNKTLMNLIQGELPQMNIGNINIDGINESNKEAFGFAYLGYLHKQNLPGNIPSVTGARQQTVLGKMRLPQI